MYESLYDRSPGHTIQDATEDGESLLSLACSAGYYELAEVLLRMRASVEDRGVKGQLCFVGSKVTQLPNVFFHWLEVYGQYCTEACDNGHVSRIHVITCLH